MEIRCLGMFVQNQMFHNMSDQKLRLKFEVMPIMDNRHMFDVI